MSKTEIKNVILSFKIGKSLGVYGLPIEFYKTNMASVVDDLFDVYSDTNRTGTPESEEVGEELETEEAERPKDEREDRFLRAVAQASRVHKVEVLNFSKMLNPKDLIDWIEELEDYFEFEDIKDPQRVQLAYIEESYQYALKVEEKGMERSCMVNEELEGGVIGTECAPEQGESLMFKRVLVEHSNEDTGSTERRSLFRTVCKSGNKCCKVIVDTGSTRNLVSEEMNFDTASWERISPPLGAYESFKENKVQIGDKNINKDKQVVIVEEQGEDDEQQGKEDEKHNKDEGQQGDEDEQHDGEENQDDVEEEDQDENVDED
ncbi:uncharacterized protein LOC131869516 [Cryptomeria japonica]|uniref:uncharacterized protein LOC131869516 n=1 Tax=Cryptomeria japonica TaxID=3369 RepID=UPI0027DA3BEA|nr:uncharacterized protein LOC131869516 [Cryptomeria japonica]